jgi:hypothetical protein
VSRPIYEIAREIRAAWQPPGKIYFGAVPYLEAMETLDSVDDAYGADDAKSIVIYFLGNAASFRGPDARRLKAELKALVK